MGEYADDAIQAGLDQSWGWRRSRRTYQKPTNKEIFREFAHPENGLCKVGQRVVHVPSGVAGEVLSTRGDQVCWRPDTRIKAGGVWVDIAQFRSEI